MAFGGAQLRQLTSTVSGSHLNLHHALFWRLQQEISTVKLFCGASAREDSFPEEENKALSHSPLSQVASWQLVRHPRYTLAIKIQLLHRDLVTWKALGCCRCRAQTSREFAASPNYGACWEHEAVSIPTKTTMTTGTGICLRALPYLPCWRKQMSVMVFWLYEDSAMQPAGSERQISFLRHSSLH